MEKKLTLKYPSGKIEIIQEDKEGVILEVRKNKELIGFITGLDILNYLKEVTK